jgi:magnesium chelatase subunit H
VFASALDARPAMERYFGVRREDAAWRLERPAIDAFVNLTGFSLVGGPAYNDAPAAQAVLTALDVPYLSLQTLEFQSVAEWQADPRGLNPLQATLQVAIPELDGAIAPTVFGGRGAGSIDVPAPASQPLPERVEAVADRVAKLVRLRRTPRAERKLAIVLFNFPPNAGNTGSAAYLAVFASLQRVLASLKEQGYTVALPGGVDELRTAVCDGNRERFGTPANVHTRIPAEELVRREPHLREIEAVWGPAPGRQLSDGGGVFVLGAQFGNVLVGVQPSFGWEGDPMRLLFEGGFSPTHAFSAFYRYLREDFAASAVLHFGTHGAVEFMPGKQAGLSGDCWPERLTRDLPNVYLYASNNSSEGTLAKRRGNATLVSYLTPPVANAGLYRGLAELKVTLERWRGSDNPAERASLLPLVQEQGAALELCTREPAWDAATCDARAAELRARLLEVEYALIPVGLHVVGDGMPAADRVDTLLAMAQVARPEQELPSLHEALGGGAAAEQHARAVVEALVHGGVDAARRTTAQTGTDVRRLAPVLDELARLDALLREDHEVPGLLRALDARYVRPAPGGDLLRTPACAADGAQPVRLRSVSRAERVRAPGGPGARRAADRAPPRRRARVPRDGRLRALGHGQHEERGGSARAGARPARRRAALRCRRPAVRRPAGAARTARPTAGRRRRDALRDLSRPAAASGQAAGEAALLAAGADEPEDRNFVRGHARATMRETGCDLETAALRVFGNADGAYGSNVNLLVETGQWSSQEELAEQFVRRKCFAYGVKRAPVAMPDLLRRTLGTASLSFQNLDSVELGATDIDQYVESLGGMNRVIAQARGADAPVYLGDHTGATGRVRTLDEQVALESRTRLLNPKWYEAQLASGYEGARNIAGHVTTTFGWSATGNASTVPGWVYAEVGSTFVLDEAMRERLAQLNPSAAGAIAGRLLEASDRGYWHPDDATLAALRDAAADLEDRLEGIAA